MRSDWYGFSACIGENLQLLIGRYFRCKVGWVRRGLIWTAAKLLRKQVLDGLGAYLCLRWYQASAASGLDCSHNVDTPGLCPIPWRLRAFNWIISNQIHIIHCLHLLTTSWSSWAFPRGICYPCIPRSLSPSHALTATSACAWHKWTPTRIFDAPRSGWTGTG